MIAPAELCDVHAAGRRLNQSEIDNFGCRGVGQNALTGPLPVLADRVTFQANGLFEFARHLGEDGDGHAFTIMVEGIDGPLDIVAWQPKTNRIALWLGRAFALGEEQLWQPRLGGEPLRVWRTPMTWLRAQRQGVVILRPSAAPFYFDCVPAALPEDFEHAEELERILTPSKPKTKILLPDDRRQTERSTAA